MRKTKLLSIALILGLAACVNYSNQFAPDRERRPDVSGDPRGLHSFFAMKDAQAQRHFAGGLDAGAFDGEFRKGGPLIQLRLAADSGAGWKFQVKYRSGTAQTVEVRVNGTKLGDFAAEGVGQWSAAVPAGTLLDDAAAVVEIVSSEGIAIAAVGFVRS